MKIIAVNTTLFLLFVSSCVFCQYNADNIKKYWYYRWRLTQFFTSVGPNRGQSIIMANRNAVPFSSGSSTGTDLFSYSETLQNHGQYLGVLATEYKLLNDNGQELFKTYNI